MFQISELLKKIWFSTVLQTSFISQKLMITVTTVSEDMSFLIQTTQILALSCSQAEGGATAPLVFNSMNPVLVPQVLPWSWSVRWWWRCTRSRLRTFTKSCRLRPLPTTRCLPNRVAPPPPPAGRSTRLLTRRHTPPHSCSRSLSPFSPLFLCKCFDCLKFCPGLHLCVVQKRTEKKPL